VRLVECFGTDVFIKGNECSLYITRSSDIARLREIVSVILLAKLVVVSSLLERAGSLVDIKPSLAEKGFMAFLQFVRDFAELFGGKDALDLMKQMFRQGYGADNMGFSCVVVPVLWPEEVQRVNSAGAGDTISGIVAALLPD
jgi:hypothetical protein